LTPSSLDAHLDARKQNPKKRAATNRWRRFILVLNILIIDGEK
jgi:hypothetical protein